MARKSTSKRKQRAPEEKETYLTLEIKHFDVSIHFGLNPLATILNMRTDDTFVYDSYSQIDLVTEVIAPQNQAQSEYRLELTSEVDAAFAHRVRDYARMLNADHEPVVKRVRGTEVPLYNLPKAIGWVDRRHRDEGYIPVYIRLPTQQVHALIALLPHVRPLYISLHEVLSERRRRVHSFTVRTEKPEDE